MTWDAMALRSEVAAEFQALAARASRPDLSSSHIVMWRRYYCRAWSRPAIACASCGVHFTPLHARRTFCSKRCLNRFYSDRRAAKRLAVRQDRVCANPRCGHVFTGQRADTRYCSFACQRRHNYAVSYVRCVKRATLCALCEQRFERLYVHEVYCSPRCRARAKWRRRRARTVASQKGC